MSPRPPLFAKEADLCAAFIAALPPEWRAYPETSGFDILLVRKADGFQIGVQAKLRLNAKVLSQAAEPATAYAATKPGPDCRAVLVPHGVTRDLANLAPLLQVTVIWMSSVTMLEWSPVAFVPSLPQGLHLANDSQWYELAPERRCPVPGYIPDVIAGASAPVALTPWKIGAIKLVVLLERRGYLTRADVKHFGISMPRWIAGGHWLLSDGNGGWIAGPYLPDFRSQHPRNFDEIAADFDAWAPPPDAAQRAAANTQP